MLIPEIRQIEDVLSPDLLRELQENEEEVEILRTPNGEKRGVIGETIIVEDSDGEKRLISAKTGKDLRLDFGDFYLEDYNSDPKFIDDKEPPQGKKCFNGPFFKRLYLKDKPTDVVIYYGFWAKGCYHYISGDEFNDFLNNTGYYRDMYDRIYIGGYVSDGISNYLGQADFEGFTDTLITPNILLTKEVDIEYEDKKDIGPDYFEDDEWNDGYEMELNKDDFGAYDLRKKKQLIKNCAFAIKKNSFWQKYKVKSELLIFRDRYDDSGIPFYYNHPTHLITSVFNGFGNPFREIEEWRPKLIESPLYIESGEGMLNIYPYAGIIIEDLIQDNPKELLSLVKRNYIHIDYDLIEYWMEQNQEEDWGLSDAWFNKLILANDNHNLYEDINDKEDVLKVFASSLQERHPFAPNYTIPLITPIKHSDWSLERLLSEDYPYIDNLIRKRRVRVRPTLLTTYTDKVPERYQKDFSTLIQSVEKWEKEIQAFEEEQYEAWQDEMEQMRREEEQRYNWRDNYSSAFDDDPDAYWNID